MRRRHSTILSLHWSERAYERGAGDSYRWLDFEEDDPEAEKHQPPMSRALFPLINVGARMRRPRLYEFFMTVKRGLGLAEEIPEIDVIGPVSDDIVPIIFGYDHQAVYVRVDIALQLRPLLNPTQRLLPVRCDGEPIPYELLVDLAPSVYLPVDWCYMPCEERSAKEFDDGDTLISPIFPDTFPQQVGAYCVGNYGGLFLDLEVLKKLRKSAPNWSQWLSTLRIVVDDTLPSDPEMYFRQPDVL
jgi:hypothetical protein